MLELRQLPEFPVQLATNSEVRLTKREEALLPPFLLLGALFRQLGVTENVNYSSSTLVRAQVLA